MTDFKTTKIGSIPKDWDVVNLEEIGEFKNGINKDKDQFGYGYPMLNINDIFNGTFQNDNLSLVNSTENERRDYSLKSGDVLIVRSSVKPVGVGLTLAIINDLKDFVFSGFIIRFRPNELLNTEFKKHCFDEEGFRRRLLSRSTISANTNINQQALKTLKIALPPIKEQKKIAPILTQWDEAMETTQNLIEKLKLRKKGLMQELLSGKKRLAGFTEKWSEEPLGKFIRYTPRPKEKPKNHYLALGLRSHGKGIFHKNNFDPNSIAMDTLYEVRENDLVVNITFAWEHAIAIANSKDEGGLVSHRFPTYTFVENLADPIFFRYYVLQKRFKYLLNVISPGGAGRNRVMSKKDFPKLIVKVPPFNEQVAISKVLSSVDNEIEILSERLKTQKTQKKGLMQQLLTGQKRVI